jgi:hypothetical protein
MFGLILALAILTGIYGDDLQDQEIIESVEYGFVSPNTQFTLENNDSKKSLHYTPTTSSSPSLTINFESFSLGTTLSNSRASDDDTDYSSYSDFILRTPLYKGIFEFYYAQYRGFKIGNDEDDLLLPINSLSYGFSFEFFINPEVDNLKTLGHRKKEKASDYGHFLQVGYVKNRLDSQNSLVPSNSFDFESFDGLTLFDQDSVFILYGIAGSYSYKKFYIQGSIGTGINFSQIRYEGIELETSRNTGGAGKIQTNFGYEFKDSILGYELLMLQVSDLQSESQLTVSRVDSQLYYHYFF